jgi:hypothetical protein
MRALHGCLAALAGVLIALSACSDSTKPPRERPVQITGTVLDAEGAPVVGASIMLQHAYETVPGSAAAKPQTGIEFTITEPDTADIWISSPCTGDTVRVVERQYPLGAGNYTMFWRGLDRADRRVGDGLFRLNLVGRHADLRVDFLFARDDWAALADGQPVAALATTDDDGAFAIDTTCLPFGYEFGAHDEYGAPASRSTVSRSVRLWAVIPGQGVTGSDWVTVDAEDGAKVVIAPAPPVPPVAGPDP